MRVIEAAGFTLEPQTAAHAEQMFAVLSDPAIYQHENEPPPSIEWLRTRFTKLESRHSPDGREQWFNWVIRLPTSELIGYVQATVRSNASAAIAYELSSAYWGRGLASGAVEAMLGELQEGIRFAASPLCSSATTSAQGACWSGSAFCLPRRRSMPEARSSRGSCS
jgi:RimJ/RimL family protein N-acetyltransferase